MTATRIPPRMIARFAGSLALASLVVTAMFVIGMQVWGVFDEEEQRPRELEEIRLLTARERLELAWLLGEEQGRPSPPTAQEIPVLPLAPRTISGFVQLEVRVAPDGSVEEVDVLGAAPAGVFEERAREIVRGRRYPPPAGDASGTHTEIIDFSVPAAEPPVP